MNSHTVSVNPPQFKIPNQIMLGVLQKLLGDINWNRSFLQVTTGDLLPLFQTLEGDPDPSSVRFIDHRALLLQARLRSH